MYLPGARLTVSVTPYLSSQPFVQMTLRPGVTLCRQVGDRKEIGDALLSQVRSGSRLYVTAHPDEAVTETGLGQNLGMSSSFVWR